MYRHVIEGSGPQRHLTELLDQKRIRYSRAELLNAQQRNSGRYRSAAVVFETGRTFIVGNKDTVDMDTLPAGEYTSTIYGAIKDQRYGEAIDILQVTVVLFILLVIRLLIYVICRWRWVTFPGVERHSLY